MEKKSFAAWTYKVNTMCIWRCKMDYDFGLTPIRARFIGTKMKKRLLTKFGDDHFAECWHSSKDQQKVKTRCIMPFFAEQLHAKCQFMTSLIFLSRIIRSQTKEMKSYHATWYFRCSKITINICHFQGRLTIKCRE